jgi:hypothetical protein
MLARRGHGDRTEDRLYRAAPRLFTEVGLPTRATEALLLQIRRCLLRYDIHLDGGHEGFACGQPQSQRLHRPLFFLSGYDVLSLFRPIVRYANHFNAVVHHPPSAAAAVQRAAHWLLCG